VETSENGLTPIARRVVSVDRADTGLARENASFALKVKALKGNNKVHVPTRTAIRCRQRFSVSDTDVLSRLTAASYFEEKG